MIKRTEKTKIFWLFLIVILLSSSAIAVTNTIFSDVNGDGRTDIFAEYFSLSVSFFFSWLTLNS